MPSVTDSSLLALSSITCILSSAYIGLDVSTFADAKVKLRKLKMSLLRTYIPLPVRQRVPVLLIKRVPENLTEEDEAYVRRVIVDDDLGYAWIPVGIKDLQTYGTEDDLVDMVRKLERWKLAIEAQKTGLLQDPPLFFLTRAALDKIHDGMYQIYLYTLDIKVLLLI